MASESATFLRVLIDTKDQEGKVWIARCLETGNVTSANSYDRVREMILDILRGEVLYARKYNNIKALFRSPIPQDLLDRWNEITRDHPPEEVALFPQGAPEVEMARAA